MWSTIALAADMADDSLRAFSIAAPRLCTVYNMMTSYKQMQAIKNLPLRCNFTLIKSPFSQASSLTAAYTCWQSVPRHTIACDTSGNCVEEWLPHMITFLTALGFTPSLSATWWECAVNICSGQRGGGGADLCCSSVMIQSSEAGEVSHWEWRSGLDTCQTISVRRITDHQYLWGVRLLHCGKVWRQKI